ncbi:MAG: hypothetical protein MRK00_09955 [Nitrosomonas sp.]|nr:hypothetical protein [Nitrosomonas sp.]
MISIEEFKELAPKKLMWLVEKGFRRTEDFEKTSTTMATLVYCGENVAFEFSLDVRDQCVDAEVIQVKDGRLLRNWDGGYSSDIYNYLVKYEGYRGRPTGTLTKSPELSELDWAIDGWISLLDTAGSTLLSDHSGTLS